VTLTTGPPGDTCTDPVWVVGKTSTAADAGPADTINMVAAAIATTRNDIKNDLPLISPLLLYGHALSAK
jgi:hypothetical protein